MNILYPPVRGHGHMPGHEKCGLVKSEKRKLAVPDCKLYLLLELSIKVVVPFAFIYPAAPFSFSYFLVGEFVPEKAINVRGHESNPPRQTIFA